MKSPLSIAKGHFSRELQNRDVYTVRYGTHMRCTRRRSGTPQGQARCDTWPIACGIRYSAWQEERTAIPTHGRHTRAQAPLKQPHARPNPCRKQHSKLQQSPTAQQHSKASRAPRHTGQIRALPVWGHKIKQAHRAVQALHPRCHPNPIPIIPMPPS